MLHIYYEFSVKNKIALVLILAVLLTARLHFAARRILRRSVYPDLERIPVLLCNRKSRYGSGIL
jgi:hypothetical protein